LGGGRVHGVVNALGGRAGAGHQDRARPVPGADEDVLGPRRAVQVVPLPQAALLALDDRDALAGQDEEPLLVGLRVVAPVRLPRLDYVDVHAVLPEPGIVGLERAPDPLVGVPPPARLREVEHEPPLARHDLSRLGLLDLRLVDSHAPTLSDADAPGRPALHRGPRERPGEPGAMPRPIASRAAVFTAARIRPGPPSARSARAGRRRRGAGPGAA